MLYYIDGPYFILVIKNSQILNTHNLQQFSLKLLTYHLNEPLIVFSGFLNFFSSSHDMFYQVISAKNNWNRRPK